MNAKLNMKKALMGITYAACLTMGGQAQAAWVDPVNFLPSGSDIQFKYNNFETIVTAVDQELTGIVNFSSINDTLGNVFWAAGLSGSQLTGIFSGLIVDSISTDASGSEIKFTGGTLSIYNVANGTFNPAATDPAHQVCGSTGVCPAAWLTFNFVPGIIPGDTTTTLFSTVTSITAPLSGTGDGKLMISGGTAASHFAPNFSLQSNLQSCPTTDPDFQGNCQKAGNYPIVSFDPLIGRTVPEPTMLMLIGIGFAGLGWGRRKAIAA